MVAAHRGDDDVRFIDTSLAVDHQPATGTTIVGQEGQLRSSNTAGLWPVHDDAYFTRYQENYVEDGAV